MQESQSFLSVRCRSKCRSRSHVSVLGAEVTVISQYQVSVEQKSMACVSVKPEARPRGFAKNARQNEGLRYFSQKILRANPLKIKGKTIKKTRSKAYFARFFFKNYLNGREMATFARFAHEIRAILHKIFGKNRKIDCALTKS